MRRYDPSDNHLAKKKVQEACILIDEGLSVSFADLLNGNVATICLIIVEHLSVMLEKEIKQPSLQLSPDLIPQSTNKVEQFNLTITLRRSYY